MLPLTPDLIDATVEDKRLKHRAPTRFVGSETRSLDHTASWPSTNGPVSGVHVFSTGTVAIHPQHAYGSHAPTYWWILTSRQWLRHRPINVFVVEHPKGLVLFDTGQDRRSVTDPTYFPGGPLGLFYRRLARFDIAPEETLSAGLRGLGHQPEDVRYVVLSHLHQDHIGGLTDLPNATVLASAREYAELSRPIPEARGMLAEHIDLPDVTWNPVRFEPLDDSNVRPFETGLDLMGDGSMILIPTPGHTPGSMSMLVRRPGTAPLLMVGDLTYDARAMREGAIPGVGSTKTIRATTRRVLELERANPGMEILAAHDPDAGRWLRSASAA